MKTHHPVLNILWNWAGVIVETAVAFLIAPFLFNRLGDETYSLWIVIGSLTGSFGMLDLGMRGAVGRFVAFHSAKGDSYAVQRTLSTAALFLSAVGLSSFVAVACLAWALPRLYAIPESKVDAVQTATLIVGLQLAVFFVLRMFDGALWGYQRFDLLNSVDASAALLRIVLVIWLISDGGGLVALAWISMGVVVCSGLAKIWFTYREIPGLQIRARFATGAVLRELVGYGCWNFVISVAGMARSHFSPLLIGALVGLKAAGPFSIVMRLPTAALMILTATTSVFTPVAVALHVQGDNAGRKRLLIEGTRLSLSLSLYFAALFIWLGKPLLTLWIKPEFAEHWPLLVVLGCGEVLPMAMSVATGMILAMARHRILAWLAIAETATALVAAACLGSTTGLIGFVIALAAVAAFFRGICVLFYICRLTSIGLPEFLRQTFVAPCACAIAACCLIHALVTSYPPTSWPMLIVYTALFTATYGLFVAWGVLGRDRTLAVLTRMRKPRVVEA